MARRHAITATHTNLNVVGKRIVNFLCATVLKLINSSVFTPVFIPRVEEMVWRKGRGQRRGRKNVGAGAGGRGADAAVNVRTSKVLKDSTIKSFTAIGDEGGKRLNLLSARTKKQIFYLYTTGSKFLTSVLTFRFGVGACIGS
ncbi:hypothetical protein BC829DRAFT_418557 [Chytridium lagenaria]|nr:hypothetical protein BC829DRAFT_418557 [Chytridium lagenaria]